MLWAPRRQQVGLGEGGRRLRRRGEWTVKPPPRSATTKPGPAARAVRRANMAYWKRAARGYVRYLARRGTCRSSSVRRHVRRPSLKKSPVSARPWRIRTAARSLGDVMVVFHHLGLPLAMVCPARLHTTGAFGSKAAIRVRRVGGGGGAAVNGCPVKSQLMSARHITADSARDTYLFQTDLRCGSLTEPRVAHVPRGLIAWPPGVCSDQRQGEGCQRARQRPPIIDFCCSQRTQNGMRALRRCTARHRLRES